MAEIENIPSPGDYSPNIDAEVKMSPGVRLNMIKAYTAKTFGKEPSADRILAERRLAKLPDAELKSVLGVKDVSNTKRKLTADQIAALGAMVVMPDAFDAFRESYTAAKEAEPMIFGGAIRGAAGQMLASGKMKTINSPEIARFKTARRILFNPIARGLGGEKGPLSNFDIQAWEDGIPSERDTPEEVEARLNGLLQQTRAVVQTNLDGLAASGYDVDQYKKVAQKKGLYSPAEPQGQPNVP